MKHVVDDEMGYPIQLPPAKYKGKDSVVKSGMLSYIRTSRQFGGWCNHRMKCLRGWCLSRRWLEGCKRVTHCSSRSDVQRMVLKVGVKMEWRNIRFLIAVARKLRKCVTKESEESCEKNKHFDRLRDCRRN